ncbi:MAG: RnfABCDGE type electron transport complex subunit G [Desulfomonilia bacterium]|nr:RnfABCDGE type electron transport complex subunit G [Desulfomonilia bacterium]
MKEIIRLITVLTVVCALAGLSLSFVNSATQDARAYQDRLELLSALTMVLPDHDNEPDEDIIDVSGTTYYLARTEGLITGVAFITASEKGYSGLIRVIVGVTPEGEVITIGILEQKETPGLGTKIADNWFKGQYRGKTLDNAAWAVKKDTGDFDQISGATISSRAVTEAVKEGLEAFAAHRQEILGGSDGVQ